MLKKILAAVLTAFFLAASFSGAAEARSLWRDNSFGIYSDRKARNVGDILTIVISETTRQSATASRSNSKSGSVSIGAGTGVFDFLKALGASGSDNWEAEGSVTDNNSVSGQITVTVVEVLPNDNMIVEGTQSIWQNRDEHKITLRGIVRRDDVTFANTVPSSKVADATLRFDGKGPLNAKQRQGILTQVFNFLF
ncbi:MAG: flagellar basal body L-ring protein FlgH [Selenomonadaceae bacterium]|nr:flagellar basal body L-ring protein FlgH [Selenomonadaceae bacterium]